MGWLIHHFWRLLKSSYIGGYLGESQIKNCIYLLRISQILCDLACPLACKIFEFVFAVEALGVTSSKQNLARVTPVNSANVFV